MLHCCLWDDYAKQFSDALASYNGDDEICIIIKHCRIKPAQGLYIFLSHNAYKIFLNPITNNLTLIYVLGNYPVCFTNAWDGTQLLFNHVCPEVAKFRELLVVSY